MLQSSYCLELTPARWLRSPYYLSSAAPSDEDEDEEEAQGDEDERVLLANADGDADGSTLLDVASEVEPPVR